MARVKGAMATRKRRNKTLKLAKGYWGAKSKHFKMAKEAVMKSGNYAYIGRRLKKRDFRQLWITRRQASKSTERCFPKSLSTTQQVSQHLLKRLRLLFNFRKQAVSQRRMSM